MRSGFPALVPLLALVVLVTVAPACKGKPEIAFEIALPSAVVGQTVWFEIGASPFLSPISTKSVVAFR